MLAPGCDDLLLIQNGRGGVFRHVGLAVVGIGVRAPGAHLLPGFGSELIVDEEAHLGMPVGFQSVELFDEGRLPARARGFAAKLMRVRHLAEKLDGIVDLIDAEIEVGYVDGGDLDEGLLAYGIGLGAGQRKVWLLLIGLAGQKNGERKEECEPLHKMFQR